MSAMSNISTTSETEHSKHAINANENDFESSDVPVDDEEEFSEYAKEEFSEYVKEEFSENIKDEFPDDDEQPIYCDVEINEPETNSTKQPTLKKKWQFVHLDGTDNEAISKKIKMVPEEDDSDFCFLRSLLPDLKKMDDDQKRQYKIQMISAAGIILNKHIVPPNQQQSNLHISSSCSCNL